MEIIYLWLILYTSNGMQVVYQSTHQDHELCRDAGELYVERDPRVRGYLCINGSAEGGHVAK
jgi:hypothetical protein